MTERSWRARLDGALLALSVTFGTLPIALLLSAALARYLPLSDDARFALGFASSIPLWVSIMCVALLAKTGARALAGCVTASLLLALLILPLGC
jgi:predicted permease